MTDAEHFELQLSLPHDVRLAATLRGLAVHAARYAGCADERAEAFGASVEEVARGCLEASEAGADIPVVVRRMSGPVEVQIDTRTIAIDVR